MPRKPRVRDQSTSTSDKIADRETWLSQWKELGVRMLPRWASAATRATLRQEIDKGLVGHGPQDPVHEIVDIVTALAQEEVDQLRKKSSSSFSTWVIPMIALTATVARTPQGEKAIKKGARAVQEKISAWFQGKTREPPENDESNIDRKETKH